MYSNEIWRVEVEPSVRKALKRLSRDDNRRVTEVLDEMTRDPYAGDVRKLGGMDNSWRRRVGAYRIFYEIGVQEKRVSVFKLERRSSNTY